MKPVPIGTKVRLTVDLTRYHPGLTVGAEGVVAGQTGLWSRNAPRFIGVTFDFGTWDILWSSLVPAKI